MSSGKPKPGGGAKRNSVMLQPAGGPGGGALIPDFESDEEDEQAAPSSSAPAPSGGGAGGIPGGPIPGVQSGGGSGATKPGDPNHRPLVGGFAAAAYEAARAHHYRTQAAKEKRKQSKPSS